MSRRGRHKLLFTLLPATVVLVLASLTGCGGGGGDGGGEGDASNRGDQPSSAPTRQASEDAGGPVLPADNVWVATARPPIVPVFAEADDAGSPAHVLDNPTPVGAPLTFLVDGTDVSGDLIPVLLPTPPNGSKGWVRAHDVTVQADPYRIRVELGAHRLTVTNAGQVTVDTPVAVGDQGMETPTGTYFLKELLQPPDPGGAYGPYAYGISGYTTNPDVAAQFGGDGVIGIHGTNQPELLGTDVSHGCIRVANDVITEMVSYLPLGTPVDIQA